MKKTCFPLLALTFALCLSSCIKSIPTRSSESDQTVMLHWLSSDQEGIIRNTGGDQNSTEKPEPFSGKAIETFEQSPTKSVSSWEDGKKDGETVEFFYNGRKRRIINYSEGIRDGVSKEFRITGELLREENYLAGKLEGLKSEWHPNGQKIMEVTMKEGVPHGESKEWYLDGNPKSSTIYRHGLREGPASEWYTTGQRKLGLFYQKDKQHGLRTIWYENGQQRLIAQFNDDKMEGNSKGWFPDGQQQFDYNFRNNQEHGICTEWNQKGERVSELRFVDGAPVQDLLTGKRVSSITINEQPTDNIPVPPTISVDPSKKVNAKNTDLVDPTPQKKSSETALPSVQLIDPVSTSMPIKEKFISPPKPTVTVPDPEIKSPSLPNNSPAELNPFESSTLTPPPPPVFPPPPTVPPPVSPDQNKPTDDKSVTNGLSPAVPEQSLNPFNSVPTSSPERLPSVPVINTPPSPKSEKGEMDQFNPFDSALTPLPNNDKTNGAAQKTNPFEGNTPAEDTKNTSLRLNPFEKAGEIEKNASAIPLGDIFNSQPNTPNEEINPFDLPTPGQ